MATKQSQTKPKSEIYGGYSIKNSVGNFPTRLTLSELSKTLGIHKADISNVLNRKFDKVGRARKRLVLAYLRENGYLKQKKRRIRIVAAKPGDHMPSSWA